MDRLRQLVLLVTFKGVSWLAVRVDHEVGHCGGGGKSSA